MRILSSIIFLITAPLVVLITTIFYGGISSSEIKQELVHAHIYMAILDEVKSSVQTSNNNSQDEATSLITTLILQRITPEYIQGKTEKFIDDTGIWMEGKTTTPPTISFSDLIQNLPLLTNLEHVLAVMQQQSTDPATVKQIETLNQQINTVKSLTKNGFTIPVGQQLTGLKKTYQILKIVFPILISMLVLSFIGIIYFNKNMQSKFRWIAVVLYISALTGYLMVFLVSYLFSTAEQGLLQEHNNFITILFPALTNIVSVFMDTYRNYQTIVSVIFVSVGTLCFVLQSRARRKLSK